MKKILFPTDFSEVTQKAFVYALDLANQLNASITTLHAYQKPDVGDFVMPASLSEFYEGLDWNEFENYQQEIPALRQIADDRNLSHIQINHAMVEGETISTITKIATSEAYDLIIMGTEGASVLKEIFVGTHAGEVMEEAPCPVITIPNQADFDGRIDKIGVTIDFSTDDIKVIHNVLKLANALKANVEVLHVDLTNTGMITQKMQEFETAFANYNELTFVEIEGDSVIEAVANYAENNNIDILAMVTHKRNFIQELFSFSHAKKMTYQQKVPVYAIPEQILK